MNIQPTLTPLDGRNRDKLQVLIPYLSDLSLNKYRLMVELRYLEQLSKVKVIRKLTKKESELINRLINSYSLKDYQAIREIEKRANHDVKAVEEFVKLKLKVTTLGGVAEMVHFGLTSDDINNLAYGLMIRDCIQNVIMPQLLTIERLLRERAKAYKAVALLGRTHGQPAAPTTIGKEFLVFYARLKEKILYLKLVKLKGKLNGNTGNLNVHKSLFPKVNWLKFSADFVRSLGLMPDLITTQIEPYDSLIDLFQVLENINNTLNGLCLDMWLYISFGYFKQKVIRQEVGSTALPHKVNPIYFEGAEGGLGIANSLFEFYIRKLSYSRLQRDLSDSTVRRSFGIALGYSLLAYQSIEEAFKRIEPNREKVKKDLESHWEVISEPIQNFLRTKGYQDAYDKTKQFFRGRAVNQNGVELFIRSLKLDKKDSELLLKLTPGIYTGYATELVDMYAK